MLIGIFYSQIVESSSLVSVLFREAISHPYISFFHLLVNGFSVIYIHISREVSIEHPSVGLASLAQLAAVGMDIKVYRHSQDQNGGFLQVK